MSDLGPDNPSADYNAQIDYWSMIDAINAGAQGLRKQRGKYLPKFENEGPIDYARRADSAPLTNIYGDISRNLAAKPFSKELKLKEGSDAELEALCEDIDGQGNNLHVFASGVFRSGLDKAIDWILVDYSKAPVDPNKPRSKAEEKAAGLRPYWVSIPAERILAVYSATIGGIEQFVHVRIREDIVVRDGWKEVSKERIRVFDRKPLDGGNYAPAMFEVFEKQKDGSADRWISIEGPSAVTIGIIPLVAFVTGIRQGASWQIRPPLRDIAHLQIDEFQQESNLKTILELTCFPMLAANGMPQPFDKNGRAIPIPVGPRAVLFAPQGKWEYIETKADAIKALEEHLDSTRKNMLALGMQPMMQANLTVITSAHISVKANSAIQAWALGLKDTLEQAFKITAMWLGNVSAAPEVDIFTDFGIELGDDKDVENILKANLQGLLDDETSLSELQRRAFLSENLDIEEVHKRVTEQRKLLGAVPAKAIDPATGEGVIPPPNRTQVTKVVQ